MSRSSSCSSFTWHLIYVDALSASLNIYCNFINYFFANFFLLSHSFPALRHPLLFAVDTHTQDLYVSRCDFLMEHRVEHRANCPCSLPSCPLSASSAAICLGNLKLHHIHMHSERKREGEGARESVLQRKAILTVIASSPLSPLCHAACRVINNF